MFDCFDRGDIAGILECCSPDIEWEYGVNSTDVPWYQPQRGIEGVKRFLANVENTVFNTFERTAYLADGNIVVVLMNADYTIKANDRRVVYTDGILLFRYDDAGRLARFAHRVDTHQAWLAYHGNTPDRTSSKGSAGMM
jgi:ketosteroid isomerase-like protein